jgi:hypothetical protein
MFADYVGRFGLAEGRGDVRVVRLIALVRWTMSWGRQTLCRLRGHEMVRHFQPGRLSLGCLKCGAETPGWTIDVRPAFRRRGPARPQVHRRATSVAAGPRKDDAESGSPGTLAA